MFPLHPHESGDPFSNRSHNTRERKAGAGKRTLSGRFSADSRWLVTADIDSLHLWDLSRRECRCALVEQALKIGFGIRFTPDDRWLIVSKHCEVFVIDLQETERDPIVLGAYKYERIGFTVSADSRWLVTAEYPFETPRGRAGAERSRLGFGKSQSSGTPAILARALAATRKSSCNSRRSSLNRPAVAGSLNRPSADSLCHAAVNGFTR